MSEMYLFGYFCLLLHEALYMFTLPSAAHPSVGNDVYRNRQLQARSMAVQGNEAASQGQHQKAVKLFSQAIAYDPNDHRFLGNRSFCYEQLKQFEKLVPYFSWFIENYFMLIE